MTDKNENLEARPEQGEEPQVYNVKKDVNGWKFGRREFLAAAAATTAAAMIATNQSDATPDRDKSEASEGSVALAMTTLAMASAIPGRSFVQVWRFTNNSRKTWARGARLRLENDKGLEAPASIAVPDIAPGQTVAVQAKMVVPAELDTCQVTWHLQAAGNAAPVTSGQFVLVKACLIESAHPYLPDTNDVQTATNPDTSAQHTRVHFSQVELEPYDYYLHDYIVIRDGAGQQVQQITDSYPSGVWSDPVPGSEVQVQLITDSSNASGLDYYGYCVDQVETVRLIYLPITRKDPTPTRTPTPTPTPCQCHGYYCTCNRIHYWYPC